MTEIRIGKEEFKALSSDTRINIIKMLNERNYTLSELSAKLNMSSPTIKQHLETLVNSDLIQQKDEGRKWKYYSLTRKGKKLIEPEADTNVMILLGASIVGMVFLVYILFGTTGTNFVPEIGDNQKIFGAEDATAKAEYTSERDTTEELKTKEGIQEEGKNEIIIALIAVSLIAGFLFAKATTRKGIK